MIWLAAVESIIGRVSLINGGWGLRGVIIYPLSVWAIEILSPIVPC